MLLLGLTGGIGCGKSTVSRLLADRGATLVDADLVAREVVEPGSAGLASVVEAFGPDVLRADGALDREALGRRVFGDDPARARLGALLHPLIGQRSAELFAQAEAAGAEVLVHDVPLLVENGLQELYAEVVVVDCPAALQLERLVRRGTPETDARQRIAAQATRDQRLAVATRVLDNGGTPEQLAEQVDALWSSLGLLGHE